MSTEHAKQRIALTRKIDALEHSVTLLANRLRAISVALRELSPGPHDGTMDAEDYIPLIAGRIALLETTARQEPQESA